MPCDELYLRESLCCLQSHGVTLPLVPRFEEMIKHYLRSRQLTLALVLKVSEPHFCYQFDVMEDVTELWIVGDVVLFKIQITVVKRRNIQASPTRVYFSAHCNRIPRCVQCRCPLRPHHWVNAWLVPLATCVRCRVYFKDSIITQWFGWVVCNTRELCFCQRKNWSSSHSNLWF